MFVPPKLLAHVAVQPDMMEEIHALENPVMLDNPVQFFGNEGLDDCCGNIGMIESAKRIADIMDQRPHIGTA